MAGALAVLHMAVLSTGHLGFPHGSWLSKGSVPNRKAEALKAWPSKSHKVTSAAFCWSKQTTGEEK